MQTWGVSLLPHEGSEEDWLSLVFLTFQNPGWNRVIRCTAHCVFVFLLVLLGREFPDEVLRSSVSQGPLFLLVCLFTKHLPRFPQQQQPEILPERVELMLI